MKKFNETKVGQFLAQAAPEILELVGDAIPGAGILTNLFKAKADKTPEQEAEFEKLIREYEIEELKLRLSDVADARGLQKTALGQDDKFSKRFLYWLAAGSLLLGFVYIFVITFVTIPESNQRFADTILGVVIATIITTIYNFFFGSSKGSKDKEELKNTNK
mgnify:FL=1